MGRIVAGILLVAALVTLARSAGAQTLVVGLPGEPVQLDPAVVVDSVSLTITHQLFDTLVRFRGSTTEVEPALAERWEVSPDGRTWTFRLRAGVTFHDGTPLDAPAVAWNFARWARSGHPHHADQVRAGRVFEYWESLFEGVDERSVVAGVDAPDPRTVRLRLRRPFAPLLANLAIPAFGIASPRAVAYHGPAFGRHPVGSGPFRFVEWVPGQQVTLEANPGAWGPPPRVRRVVVRVIRDPARRLAALRAGEIHFLEGLSPDDVGSVRADPGLRLLLRPPGTTAYLAFNFRVRELQDRRVRRAIALAIDRAALVRAFYGETGLVATQFQPPSFWGHAPDLQGDPHDPARARALLREAGWGAGLREATWTDGAREPLALWYPPIGRPYLPSPREVAEAVAADLARVGIAAPPRTVDWAVYLDRVRRGRLPLYLLGWVTDNGDPDNALCYVFCEPGSPSQGFYANPELARLLRQAREIGDPAERARLYREAERRLAADAARVFLAHGRAALALVRRVTGYLAHPTGAERWDTVALAPE